MKLTGRHLEIIGELLGDRGKNRAVRMEDLAKERARPPGAKTIGAEHLRGDSGIYHAGNVLDPVGMDGAVPTGGIIERGVDAVNGRYVRFADGTQICHSSRISVPDITIGAGAIFYSGEVEWTFPMLFSTASDLCVHCNVRSAAVIWTNSRAISATVGRARLITTQSRVGPFVLELTATGRWA